MELVARLKIRAPVTEEETQTITAEAVADFLRDAVEQLASSFGQPVTVEVEDALYTQE